MPFSLVTSQVVWILSSYSFQSGGIGNGECWCHFLWLHRGLFRFSLLLLFKVEELETVSAGAVFSCHIAICFDSPFFSQPQKAVSVSGPVKSALVSGFRSVFVAVVLLILFQLSLRCCFSLHNCSRSCLPVVMEKLLQLFVLFFVCFFHIFLLL